MPVNPPAGKGDGRHPDKDGYQRISGKPGCLTARGRNGIRSPAKLQAGQGTFATDAGYLLKESGLRKMSESGRGPCTATRKGINRLMTQEQFRLLNNWNITGNLWSVLKLDYNLIHHRARSITGMFRHFLYSISAFPFHKAHDFRNKPSLKSFLLKKPGF